MTDEEMMAYHKAMIEMCAQVDSQPKNTFMPIPKGEEYKHMCFQLAQGYEMDYIHFHDIIVNEFGEGEHIDAFNRRHPNFAQDIMDCRKWWEQKKGFIKPKV